MQVNRENLAWAAGLFEGEGWVTVNPNRLQPELGLGMSDLDIVERFAEIMTLERPNIVRKYTLKNGRKPTYRVMFYGFERVQAIIAMFWPYLGERRRERAVYLLSCAPLNNPLSRTRYAS